MNYRDLQNISYLSHQILTESASEEHDTMNRFPYTSPYLQEDRSGYGDDSKFKQDTDADSFRPGVDVPKPKKYGRISRYSPMGGQRSRTASAVTRATEGPGEPQAVTMPRQGRKPKANTRLSREIIRRGEQAEGFDLYDLVLAHLIDEGYAETQDAANAIMANMSEEWRESIVESGYRGNSGGPEPQTVGGTERPGVPGETYGERQERMEPKTIRKKSKYGRNAPAGYMQTRKPTLQQMSSREKEAWRNRGIGA